MGVAHQGRQPNSKSNSFLKTSPAIPQEVRRGSFNVEGRAHILSILGVLSVQGSVMSVPAPRGVTQACGLSGLVGIGMEPESAWLDKQRGGEQWGTQV